MNKNNFDPKEGQSYNNWFQNLDNWNNDYSYNPPKLENRFQGLKNNWNNDFFHNRSEKESVFEKTIKIIFSIVIVAKFVVSKSIELTNFFFSTLLKIIITIFEILWYSIKSIKNFFFDNFLFDFFNKPNFWHDVKFMTPYFREPYNDDFEYSKKENFWSLFKNLLTSLWTILLIIVTGVVLTFNSPSYQERELKVSAPPGSFNAFNNPIQERNEVLPNVTYSQQDPPIQRKSFEKETKKIIEKKDIPFVRTKLFIQKIFPSVSFKDLRVNIPEAKTVVFKNHGPVQTMDHLNENFKKQKDSIRDKYKTINKEIPNIVEEIFKKIDCQLEISRDFLINKEDKVAAEYLNGERDMLPAYEKTVSGVFVEKAIVAVREAGDDKILLAKKVAEVLNNPGEDCLTIIPLMNKIKNTENANITRPQSKVFWNTLVTDLNLSQDDEILLIRAHLVPDAWSDSPTYGDAEGTSRMIRLPGKKFPQPFVQTYTNRVMLPKFLENYFEQKNIVEYGVQNTKKESPYVMENYGGSTSPDYKYTIWKATFDKSFRKILPETYQQEATIEIKRRNTI